MLYHPIHLTLPAWTHDLVDPAPTYPRDDAQVALALDVDGFRQWVAEVLSRAP